MSVFPLSINIKPIQRAISKHGLKRILILDWDIHHGDGTQDIFEESSEVLYISLHRHDGGFFFPMGANKDHSYVGKERGKGYTVNIPWSYDDMGDAEYLAAFYKVSSFFSGSNEKSR